MAVPDTGTPSRNAPVAAPLQPPAARPTTTFKDRTASQQRIDDILETGRRRSIALQAGQNPTMADTLRRTSDQDNNVFEESSADENTSIIRRDRNKAGDYHTTKAALKTKSGQAAGRQSEEPSQGPEQASARSERLLPVSWWKKQLKKLGSIELENKGSVARDHLALERTFLAWLRTSLAFASIGIAITQLFRLNTSITGSDTSDPYFDLRQVGKPLGATFLGISILVLFVGFHRYFESQHWILRGKFPASRGSVALITIVALLLMVASLIVVLVVQPNAFEKR